MAHVKAGGKARQGTPRKGRRLGVKTFTGHAVKSGDIIVRQAGSSFHPAGGTKMGRDFTIFSMKTGKVNFRVLKGRRIVEVI